MLPTVRFWIINIEFIKWSHNREKVAKLVIGVGLVISRSLVQFPARALWSVLGQDSLFHIASVYPAAKWVPSINKAVLRACALYAASCSGISPRGIEMVSVCTGLLGEQGCVNISVIPLQ